MMPTENLENWEEKKEQIREKIRTLRNEHGIKQKEVSNDSKWGHRLSTLNRFLNDKKFKISDEKVCLMKLDRYCDEIIYSSISKSVDDIEHPLYHSLLKSLQIKNHNQNFIKNNILGTYKFYVGSYFMPVKFPGIILGYMNIYKKDGCILVDEYQKCDGKYGTGQKVEENHGYMIRKSNKLYIVSSQKQEEDREDLKITVFHKKIPSRSIGHLEGVVFGTSHDFGIFNSRIVMEKIGDNSLFEKEKSNAKVISIEDIEKEKIDSEFEHYLFYELIRKERSRDDKTVLIW